MINRRTLLSTAAASGILSTTGSPAGAWGRMLADRSKPAIFVNQIGYMPSWSKIAIVQGVTKSTAVKVVDLSNNRVVEHVLAKPMKVPLSDAENMMTADFSKLTRSGRFALVSGNVKSASFEVGVDVYAPLFRSLLRSYYLQRCGFALADEETGLSHATCHEHDGVLARSDAINEKGTKIANPGGWHDAGDFGKYVTTTAVAIGEILSLYERHPRLFSDGQLSIPESGNGRPDVLDEMAFGLEWLLTMQRSDGAVYRKSSGAEWPKAMSPERDVQQRYVYGISTPETGKFCAVMAIAARVYAPFDERASMKYIEAALAAWQFLDGNADFIFDCEPSDNTGSGSYMANHVDKESTLLGDADDRAWAGAELFLTLREKKYLDPVYKYASVSEFGLFEWKNPAPLGYHNLIESQNTPRDLRDQLVALLQTRATQLAGNVRVSPWGLSNTRLVWGSNKMAATNGSCLMAACLEFKTAEFRTAALRQLDYLMGVNPNGKCFVTGAGAQPVEHVAHLWVRDSGIQIPGLFVGGPNNDAQDKIAPGGLGLLSYLDDARSYSTNEYAIDYNSALIRLIGNLCANTKIKRTGT
jgi:endoglucanase